MKTLTIVSRKSVLAQLQSFEVAEAIKENFPDIEINFLTKETTGDIDLTTPLHKMPEMGVFTSDIRETLLSGKADIAVHSWKDLPVELESGTEIIATIPRADLRDVLVFKPTSLNKKNIKIFTSSPRRKENLNKFLLKALPCEISSIDFEDIRGNILTRLQKLLDSNLDGLVIAKAALDRLLGADENSFTELKKFKKNINGLNWMVIPSSKNPCAPGQGALAIEVNSKNSKVKKIINKINDLDTFENVNFERESLKKYGGGCHQKIGISVENINLGKVITKKGLTPDGDEINHRYFLPHKKNLNTLTAPVNNFYPKTKKNFNLFDREPLKEGVSNLNKIRNSGLYISRASTITDEISIDSSNIVWTSGVVNWFKLAKKGIWVNGTSDNLGEKQSLPESINSKLQWFLVSHLKSRQDGKNLIATYELKEKANIEDFSKNSHFFWMSFSSYKLAVKLYPDIKDAEHSCGLGKTFDELNEINPGKIKPFLSYEDWLEKVKEAK